MAYMEGVLHSDRNKTEDLFVFWFCLIDILFLPYFWVVSIAYSLPVVVIWTLRRLGHVKFSKEIDILVLSILCLLSTLFSGFTAPDFFYTNCVYFIQYMQMFCYFFLFSFVIQKYNVHIEKPLILFVLFVFLFAVVFNVSFERYISLRFFWNRRSFSQSYDIYSGYRFGFIWSDENNIAYALSAVYILLLGKENISMIWKMVLFFALCFVLIGSASTGGILSFIIAIFLFLTTHHPRKRKYTICHIVALTIFVVLFFILLLIFINHGIINSLLNSDFFQNSTYRFSQKITPGNDSRVRIWMNFLENKPLYRYLLFGTGACTTLNHVRASTHNGFLYLTYAYGGIFCIVFCKLFFIDVEKKSKISQRIFLIPIILGFILNIMFEEIKLAGLFVLLLADQFYNAGEKYE